MSDYSYREAVAITPSNTVDIATTMALYVGGAGNLKVDMKGGTAVTFQAVPVGTVLEIKATRVYATGTTATFILGLY
jgi:hypothetical protein